MVHRQNCPQQSPPTISRHKKSPNNILHNKKFAKLGTNKQVMEVEVVVGNLLGGKTSGRDITESR